MFKRFFELETYVAWGHAYKNLADDIIKVANGSGHLVETLMRFLNVD